MMEYFEGTALNNEREAQVSITSSLGQMLQARMLQARMKLVWTKIN